MIALLLLALGWSMPGGDWLGQPGATFAHLKIGPDKAIRVTLASGAVAEGVYEATANKFSSWHVTFKPTRPAGPFEASNRLTLNFECAQGHEQVQLCLHGAGAPLCESLISDQTCTPPKAWPAGEMINPPPTLNPPPIHPQKSSLRLAP